MSRFVTCLVFCSLFLNVGLSGSLASADEGLDLQRLRLCDPAVPISKEEKKDLLERLRISNAGQKLLTEFKVLYGSLDQLVLQWDGVSYSQIISQRLQQRIPASAHKSLRANDMVCVHLARKLPKIEHLADLAHELVHATKLRRDVLMGHVKSAEEFVKARIRSEGGEAEAFAMECVVKRELLGRWDSLCSPYAKSSEDVAVDVSRVVRDLYNGQLSASLTGEPYPIMLARQFRAIAQDSK